MEIYQIILLTSYITINLIMFGLLLYFDADDTRWWEIPVVLFFGVVVLGIHASINVYDTLEYKWRMRKYKDL